VKSYLQTLPWGSDRLATAELVAAISQMTDQQSRDALADALTVHRQPGLARRLLLEGYRQVAPTQSLALGLRDLRQCREPHERVATIEWLYALQRTPAPVPENDLSKEIQADIASLNTNGWSTLERGYLDILLHTCFPQLPRTAGSTAVGRAGIRLIHLFERLRLHRLGCIVTIPVLIAIGYAYMVILNIGLGKPPAPYALLDDAGLLTWLLAAGLTARNRLSGHESLRDRFLMSCFLFGAIALFAALALLIRLIPTGAL